MKEQFAGFWLRAVAYIIDGLLLFIVSLLLFPLVILGEWGYLLSRLLTLIIGWLYFSFMESSPKQGTLGKMALGLKVTDMKGKRIGFGRATGRHFAKILSAIIIGIGFLMIAFTEKKQGLHDLIAGSLVLKK